MAVRDFLKEALSNLPEDATLEACIEEFQLACSLCKAVENVERGNYSSHEDVAARLRQQLLTIAKS